MRVVQVLFTGVTDVTKLLKALDCLGRLGTLHRHNFNFQEAGFGEAVLCTAYEHKHLEQHLALLLPDLMVGVQDLKGEECHECEVTA